MTDPQQFEPVTVASLPARVRQMQEEGYRLAQIGATALPGMIEITYSFDRLDRFAHLRLQVPAARARIPSISQVYWCAFIYENEMQDLFQVQVDGMAVDFQGQFYPTAVKYPFGSPKAPVVKPPAAPAAPRLAAVRPAPPTPAAAP
jgi:ech hydrogenase subunit D